MRGRLGDFAYYDHVANHIQLLGCKPARFGFCDDEPELARHFTPARGVAREAGGPIAGKPALEMTKWFDTNYHYLVPEFHPETAFSLASERLFAEVEEAAALGHRVKAVLVGPLTFLWLGKEKASEFDRLSLLDRLLPVYGQLLARLKAQGVEWVQIDEPAIREGLPLRRDRQRDYLAWATRAFRLSASVVADDTQIHTHMCYSEFNDILSEIAAMDADVVTIETSRSNMELLRGFGEFRYPNEIGPGVYDIHSPRIPTVEEMVGLLRKALTVIPAESLWVNPDCGLKTRSWPETEVALRNMVEAACRIRNQLAQRPEGMQSPRLEDEQHLI